ncbi:arylamine N-acetyltransferase [Streptomyces sp. NPDC058335]|uniref:arylamine N-acetyltransferase family protein n=1 Tax=Streptomyces sp. NPDC058335 TaxID=3346451 RepID=UPI0036518051
MFDVGAYLAHLQYEGPVPAPTLETLRDLHKRHLMHVPFDNALNSAEDRGLAVWQEVDIDVDETFDSVITGRRGGVCYELNGLFRRLLTDLGFEVGILAGAVIQVDGQFGPELEHIFNLVELDGDRWLVDVGLAGPSYLEPLRLTDDEVQEQYGVGYRLVPQDDGEDTAADGTDDNRYRVLQRRSRGEEWRNVYRFKPQLRKIEDWTDPAYELVEFPAELLAVGTLIRSRAFDNGQMVLIGKRYVRVVDGVEEVKVLVDRDLYKATTDAILAPSASA